MYVKQCSKIGFVTRFNLLISRGIIYESIVFKRALYYFINSYFFQIFGLRYGLNQKFYAAGNLTMYILNHLGRKFGCFCASELSPTIPPKFCPRRAVYRIRCRKY